jgi:hypothetical protein
MLRDKCVLGDTNYIHTINFAESEFENAPAITIEEKFELKKSGWQKCDEMIMNGTAMHSYFKSRRFGVSNEKVFMYTLHSDCRP